MPKLSESFNAKIKAFRAQFRGVRDRAFLGQRIFLVGKLSFKCIA